MGCIVGRSSGGSSRAGGHRCLRHRRHLRRRVRCRRRLLGHRGRLIACLTALQRHRHGRIHLDGLLNWLADDLLTLFAGVITALVGRGCSGGRGCSWTWRRAGQVGDTANNGYRGCTGACERGNVGNGVTDGGDSASRKALAFAEGRGSRLDERAELVGDVPA